MLVVTAALAVLLAVLSHLAWPPVAVAILGTVPALYLAWAALPGAISPPGPGAADKPGHGRHVEQWDPVELGVHPVIGGGPMPTYIRRPHDELLRAILDPAVPATRLVVVRGGSSTGKTRAAYQAVADRLADWQLDYPLDPGALAARLEAGIPARTVLWLGELRQYADADGGPAVLGHLADLLQSEGRLVITTMWPEQWATYTAAACAGPGTADPAGVAGRLLGRLPELTGHDPARIDPARGGVIDVPDRFAPADLQATARSGDPVLGEAAAAAAAAGQDGQLSQYLAGVPDLLRRYAGPGGDPYGQAVITAAMDATRLGHASPLPAALLQEAAVGYLTGLQRTKDIVSWRDKALDWAAEELKGAVRTLQPVPPSSGTGVVGFQIADYLDQHGRRTRQDQIGPPSASSPATPSWPGSDTGVPPGRTPPTGTSWSRGSAPWAPGRSRPTTSTSTSCAASLSNTSGVTASCRKPWPPAPTLSTFALVFNIDHTNAVAYANAARNLLSSPAGQALSPAPGRRVDSGRRSPRVSRRPHDHVPRVVVSRPAQRIRAGLHLDREELLAAHGHRPDLRRGAIGLVYDDPGRRGRSVPGCHRQAVPVHGRGARVQVRSGGHAECRRDPGRGGLDADAPRA